MTERIRKNIFDLNDQEIATLAKAYEGIMKKPITEITSYFYLSGLHGWPTQDCQHHIQAFLPWHRIYVNYFEDALRSVEGCQDVTLPYFYPFTQDQKTVLPDWCYKAPFASYKLDPAAQNLPTWPSWLAHMQGEQISAYATSRHTNDQIRNALTQYDVSQMIHDQIRASDWSKVANDKSDPNIDIGIEYPHDYIHGSVGGHMGDPFCAGFDPIFWFHHSNIDRFFSIWQEKHDAYTQEQLQALAGNYVIPFDSSLVYKGYDKKFTFMDGFGNKTINGDTVVYKTTPKDDPFLLGSVPDSGLSFAHGVASQLELVILLEVL